MNVSGMETHFGSSTFIHFFGTFLRNISSSRSIVVFIVLFHVFHCFSELPLYFSSLF